MDGYVEKSIEHDGKRINVIWDGDNVSVEVQDSRSAFVTSVNDITLSARGNFNVRFVETSVLQFLQKRKIN